MPAAEMKISDLVQDIVILCGSSISAARPTDVLPSTHAPLTTWGALEGFVLGLISRVYGWSLEESVTAILIAEDALKIHRFEYHGDFCLVASEPVLTSITKITHLRRRARHIQSRGRRALEALSTMPENCRQH